MTLHEFEHSQRIEQQWVPMLDNGLLEGGYSLRLATMEEQWRRDGSHCHRRKRSAASGRIQML